MLNQQTGLIYIPYLWPALGGLVSHPDSVQVLGVQTINGEKKNV